MNSLHPDASTLYTSLDDIYYYGGQKRRLHEAVLPHKANGPHEMNLLVGDEIAVAGNHWDGYSKGTNLRTKESGLYPTFKVCTYNKNCSLKIVFKNIYITSILGVSKN